MGDDVSFSCLMDCMNDGESIIESFRSYGVVSRNCFNEYVDSEQDWSEFVGEGARVFSLVNVSTARS